MEAINHRVAIRQNHWTAHNNKRRLDESWSNMEVETFSVQEWISYQMRRGGGPISSESITEDTMGGPCLLEKLCFCVSPLALRLLHQSEVL